MFSKLTKDEKLALVGVIKWVVSTDHEDSTRGIEKYFHENGWDDYNQIYSEMDEKFQDIDDLKEFLIKIKNVEARKFIIQIANEIAISDSIITNEEKKVLDFLNEIWQ
jgi:uncharacterized tellurite resistance protein B-like protein